MAKEITLNKHKRVIGIKADKSIPGLEWYHLVYEVLGGGRGVNHLD